MARPSKYTEELGTEICSQIASGVSLRDVCQQEGMPTRTTVHNWLLDPSKKMFLDQYETACNIRAENMFDELEKIADKSDDEESPMRSRLRVDTRKWYLSKIMPKKYGEKLDVTSDGQPIPLQMINITPIDGGKNT